MKFLKSEKGGMRVGNKGVNWGHGYDHAALALKAAKILDAGGV